jgi:Carboxypeptidase regulatory-like domain
MHDLMEILKRLGLVGVLIVASGLMVLAQTGGIKGTVRSVKGGGIPEATVTARQKGVGVKSATTDSKGDFTIDGLSSGLYNLVFEASGFSSGTLYNVEVKKNKVRELTERLILTSDQGTQVIIKGSVFDKYGRSLSAVEVKFEKISGDGSVRKIGTGMSSLSGEFTFRQPEGAAKFRLTASYKGVSGSKDIEVDNAAIYRLAITLDVSRDGKEQ